MNREIVDNWEYEEETNEKKEVLSRKKPIKAQFKRQIPLDEKNERQSMRPAKLNKSAALKEFNESLKE